MVQAAAEENVEVFVAAWVWVIGAADGLDSFEMFAVAVAAAFTITIGAGGSAAAQCGKALPYR